MDFHQPTTKAVRLSKNVILTQSRIEVFLILNYFDYDSTLIRHFFAEFMTKGK